MRQMVSRCIFLCTFIVLCSTAQLFSTEIIRRPTKENEDWRILKEAENAFENADYGTALSLADKAKESRKQGCAWKMYILDTSLKSSKVKKAGDHIDEVLPVLESHNSKDAIQIITDETDKYGKDFFENSISKLTAFVSKENVYPEADYLIGKVYQLEGENDLAQKFMRKALDSASALDIPQTKYDLLYDMADIANATDKNDDYEAFLLDILKDDANFMNKQTYMTGVLRIIGTDTEDAVDKLFNLFRNKNEIALDAYQKLTELYEQNGQSDKALQCAAMGSITAFTKIYDAIDDRQNEYTYQGLQRVLSDSQKYADIVEWGSKTGAWNLFYLLARESAAQGKLVFARKVYMILSIAEPVEYYRLQAEQALIK